MNWALSAEGITLQRGSRALLLNVELKVMKASIHLILGLNGSGKTLLLRCLAGLLRPDAGLIEWQQGALPAIDLPTRARLLAWVPQNQPLPFAYTVADLVLMGRFAHHSGYPSELDHEQVTRALKRLQILDFHERIYNSLSRGEQTKVDIARALAAEAPLILLDEPFANLDIDACLQLQRLLIELRAEGKTLLLSHHDLHSVRDFASHVSFIRQGQILASGSCDSHFQPAWIQAAFGVQVVEHEEAATGYRHLRFIADQHKPAPSP